MAPRSRRSTGKNKREKVPSAPRSVPRRAVSLWTPLWSDIIINKICFQWSLLSHKYQHYVLGSHLLAWWISRLAAIFLLSSKNWWNSHMPNLRWPSTSCAAQVLLKSFGVEAEYLTKMHMEVAKQVKRPQVAGLLGAVGNWKGSKDAVHNAWYQIKEFTLGSTNSLSLFVFQATRSRVGSCFKLKEFA